MRFIGITGGVGAGKSELIRFLRDHYKAVVLLADEVAYEVRKPETKCYEQLVLLLSKEVVSDSKKMASVVFSDEEMLKKVNAIIHPAVHDYIMQAKEEAEKSGDCELFFLEAALLIETGYKKVLDELWYVYADRDIRIKRLMESRNYSEEKAKSIMDSQLSDDEYRKNSDFIIDNSSSLENSYEQIKRKLEGYTWLK